MAEEYSVQEAAGQLGADTSTVTLWLRKGKLRGYKTGRKWRILKQAIEDYLEEANKKVNEPGIPFTDDLRARIRLADRARAIAGYLWGLQEEARVIGQAVVLARTFGDEYGSHEHAIIKNILRQDAHLADLAVQFEDALQSKDRERAIALVEQMRSAFERWTHA